VPVAAPALAEIDHRQAHELVPARLLLHPLQQLARAPLVLRALARAGARVREARHQRVAQPLQLAQ